MSEADDAALGFKLVCDCEASSTGMVRGPDEKGRAEVDRRVHNEMRHDGEPVAELERVEVEPQTVAGHSYVEVSDDE